MTTPIIIETTTTTRERLVLVPVDACSEVREGDPRAKLGAKVGLTVLGTYARDATAADLERAGWVREMVEPTGPGTLAHLRADLRDMTARAEKAEATLAMHGRPTYVEAVERAEKAERERDEALLRAHTGVVHYEILRQSGEEAARQRDEARAELAHLTAPGEGSEPTDEELGQAYIEAWNKAASDDEASNPVARRALFRAGVAHERARQQPAKDRATDEELAQVYRKIYETHGGGTISVSHDDCRRAGVRAVAARVRQERCLVTQAVAMRAGVTISRTSERVPGTTGMWDVYATRRPDVPGEHYAYGVPTADVPATLARLLGEVSRG